MSNQKSAISEIPVNIHNEEAQARVAELRAMRQLIPRFVIPTQKGGRQPLISTASVPAQFIELTSMATVNTPALTRGEGATAAEVRDLQSYADAYGPVADELEAFAQFLRYSIAAAKSRAGNEALTTYALATRLARRPEHADLVPHVADMRRALGRGRRSKTADATARKTQQS